MIVFPFERSGGDPGPGFLSWVLSWVDGFLSWDPTWQRGQGARQADDRQTCARSDALNQ
jgi:hypothetical protein